MLKNYFLTAIRNLKRNRTFALINILGLVLGVSGTVVIYRIIQFENSFDTYHSNVENVYRVAIHQETEGGTERGTSVQHPLGEALRNDEDYTYVSAWEWTNVSEEPMLHKEQLEFENVELKTRSYK